MTPLATELFRVDGREGIAALPFLLFFFGFLITATFFMALATLCRRHTPILGVFIILAVACVALQGGCWKVGAGIGHATGGGNDKLGPELTIVLSTSFIIWLTWSSLLLATRRRSRSPQNRSQRASAPLSPSDASDKYEY